MRCRPYRGFLAVTFHELESIMTPFGRALRSVSMSKGAVVLTVAVAIGMASSAGAIDVVTQEDFTLQMEQALELDCAGTVPKEVRDVVQGYNRDDCLSALRLRNWLEEVRAELERSGTPVPRNSSNISSASVSSSRRNLVGRSRRGAGAVDRDESTDRRGDPERGRL